MKTALLVAAAGLVAAQNLSGEPACATPCLLPAISSVCTPASDQGCACASQSAIGNFAVSCLLASCDSNGLIQAQSAAAALCVAYSATAGSANATTTTTGSTSTAAATSTITSAASLSSATGATTSAGSSTSTGSAASASSTAAAAVVQGSAALGAGLLGMLLAGVAAM